MQWLVVTDATGAVVEQTVGAPAKAKLAELDRRLVDGIKNGEIVHALVGNTTDWVYGSPVKLGVTLGYQLTTTVALEAKLPGGATWQIARPAECAGIIVVAASDG